MRIAFVTAGAAGMYCGSCMRDNTLVAALNKLGHDALLIPTYTPIRTDELDVSQGRVFYGGISVYLQDKSRLFRHAPRFIDWALSRPWLLRSGFVARKAQQSRYADLAGLTVSMLAGRDGRQRKELRKLVAHINEHVRPEVVILTNALLSSLAPALSESLGVPVWVTLQGDDIFLDALPPAARAECFAAIQRNDRAVAGYLATCAAYADHMAPYLGVDRSKVRVVHPGINAEKYAPVGLARQPASLNAGVLHDHDGERPPTIGYFARICPEKGFHNAVSAFIALRNDLGVPGVKLKAAGWLGLNNHAFFEQQVARLTAAGLASDFEHLGSPDHAGKVRFFQAVDVFTMPSEYHEPKGLSVLEALASAVPVVQPAHGSFPELVTLTGGGELYAPGDTAALARSLRDLLADPERRRKLGAAGRAGVLARFTAADMARRTVQELSVTS